MMRLIQVAKAAVAHPFGDERSVLQAFPGGVNERDADPFLMCDYFNFPGEGRVSDPDEFPVDWHPHRGMDILSYLRTGIGRHGDSLGNREEYKTPGMQWMSVGSGVYHAEGGATPKGVMQQGFQIWLNVPAKHKMDPPEYGTEPPEALPQVEINDGVKARLLAGPLGDRVGPFRTKAAVQIIDFDMHPGSNFTHSIPESMDCCILYLYEGNGRVNGRKLESQQIVVFDATGILRSFEFEADTKVSAILFAGKRIKEPIAWRGPIVMNTQDELRQTFRELQTGSFPPVRVDWDYTCISKKPCEARYDLQVE